MESLEISIQPQPAPRAKEAKDVLATARVACLRRRQFVPASSSPAPELAIIGTWKLKTIEAESQTEIPVPQQATTTFLLKEDGIQYINDSLYPDCQKRHAECTFRLDGRAYPLVGSMLGDAWSARQIDAHTFEATITRDGAISARASAIVSPDRRIMRTHWEIVPQTGPTITYASLAERQS